MSQPTHTQEQAAGNNKEPAEPPIKPAKHEDVVFEVSEADLQKVRALRACVRVCVWEGERKNKQERCGVYQPSIYIYHTTAPEPLTLHPPPHRNIPTYRNSW